MKKILKGLIISAIMGIMLLSSAVVFADTTTTTWNTNDKGPGVFLSNDNLNSEIKGYISAVRATTGKISGKWYWEVKYNSGSIYANTGYIMFIGVGNMEEKGYGTNSRLYYAYNGTSNIAPYPVIGSKYAPGDVIGVALDMDNKTLSFYINGNAQGVAFNDIGALGTTVYPMLSTGTNICDELATVNFGATTFKYPVPSGYLPYDSAQTSTSTTGITLNNQMLSLPVTQTGILVATITPSDATNNTVNWTSSDPTIATVDSTGKVTGVKVGNATITATTAGGQTAICIVTVTDSSTTTPVTPTNPPDGANTIVNIAHAKGDNTNNAGGEVSIIFNGVPDAILSVVKTADVKSVWVGDTFTYTIVVKNTGSKIAKLVVINDIAPNHIQFMPSGITTTQGTVDSSSTSSNIVVNVGDIPPSGTVTITVPATVIF